MKPGQQQDESDKVSSATVMTPVADLKPAATGEPEPSLTPDREEVLWQCDRIASSDEFQNALSQQRLLRYLVVETLEGRGSGLKEYSVGLEVFQRGQDFDPRTDAIVRVSVGQLRRRLAAYYSIVGATDRVVIHIPKGHYSVKFAFAETAAAAEVASETLQLTRPRLVLPEVGDIGPVGQRRPWAVSLVVAAAMVLTSVATWVVARHGVAARSATAVDLQNSLFWSTFLQGDTKATAVIGLATTATIGPVLVRSPSDNDEQAMEKDPNMQKIAALFNRPVMPYTVYTGIGEALAAGRLGRAFSESSLELNMLPARDVRFRDLHGQNVIFISSLHFRDIRQLLPGKRDFDTAESAPEVIQIVNHAPKPGEQATYEGSGNYVAPSVDYALVSVEPGTEANSRILEVGGAGTLGTAGAVQYLTERQSLAELDAKLKQDYPGKPGTTVQVLLRVDVGDHQVVSVHYVTHHWIK